MEDRVKVKTVSNFIWRFAERTAAQLVSFAVSIILARILAPEAYGTVALVTVFTTILQVFVDSGLGTALIQKKDADDLDFSSVFYFNFVVCLVLYAVMFVGAPYIAAFYENMELVPLIRVISLTLIISGVKNIQQAYVSKHLLFKRFFFATLGGTLFSAVCGIVLAYRGAGVWALVAQQLINATIDTLILWMTVKWRPRLMFSWTRLKELLSYGWKLLASSFLDTVYNNIRSLIIGKAYSSADLAYYNKGQQLPNLVIVNINTSIDSVLLPIMASVQDQEGRVKKMTRRSIQTSSYIIWPMMIGLAACAEPLISLLLTDKWIPCVPYLRIYCLIFAFQPIHTANLNAIKAVGRSDIFLKLEIIKKIIGLASIILTMRYGVMAMALGLLVITPLNALINAFPNRKILNYSIKEQIKDLMPYILMAGAMGALVWPIQYLQISRILVIVAQIAAGIVVYVGCSVIFRVDVFYDLFGILTGFLRKGSKNGAAE